MNFYKRRSFAKKYSNYIMHCYYEKNNKYFGYFLYIDLYIYK